MLIAVSFYRAGMVFSEELKDAIQGLQYTFEVLPFIEKSVVNSILTMNYPEYL
jgi:hypothetical protein